MSAHSPVRALARDYAEGKLDRRRYITERRALIDAIVTGRIAFEESTDEPARDYVEPPPDPSPPDDAYVDTIKLSRPLVDAARGTRAPRRWLAGALVLGAAVFALWLWHRLT
jgi:hypothetical protein